MKIITKNPKTLAAAIIVAAGIYSCQTASAQTCNDDAKDVGTSPPTGCEVDANNHACSGFCHLKVYYDLGDHKKTASVKEQKPGPIPPANPTGKVWAPRDITVWAVDYTGDCSGTADNQQDPSKCVCGNLHDGTAGEQTTVKSGDLFVCGGA